MGGLGAGGLLFGRISERTTRPLVLYSRLEFFVAAFSAITPFLIDLARLAYSAAGGTVVLGLGLGSVVRVVLSGLILGIPTLLMGGTLPAAARSIASDEDARRGRLAAIYGMNTAGAMFGAFASTFMLLEVFGTRTTLWTGCLVNLLVAVVARALARSMPMTETLPAPETSDSRSDGLPEVGKAPAWLVLVSASIVGFVFMSMELVWYRMLAPLLGGSTYTFGLILTVALAGIGLGGIAYAARRTERDSGVSTFALTCVIEAAFLALPLALGDRLAVVAMLLRSLGSIGFTGLVLGWSAVALVVVFPAAFVSGYQFPLIISLLGRGRRDIGRHVGLAYSCNTLGSLIGSLSTGFILLPILSAPGLWKLSIVLQVGLCLIATGYAVLSKQHVWRNVLAIASAILVIAMTRAPGPTALWRHSSIGAGRANFFDATPNLIQFWTNKTRHSTTWEAEGLESSVAMVGGDGISFFVNGKSDGNSIRDAGTQIMGGLVGAVLHEDPRTALVIGLGTGSTAGWLGDVPSIERVEVVEIEKAILQVAKTCAQVNRDVLNNPKVHVLLGDAREVLTSARKNYDIIFSEPSNPYRAGIASLYSREFYLSVRSRLTKDGLFLQWLQAYEVDSATVKMVMATLASAFPSVEVWQTLSGDLLFVSGAHPIVYDVARMRDRLSQEPFREGLLAAWHTTSLEGFLARFIASSALVENVAQGETSLNTDDLPLLEFAFARSVGRQTLFKARELTQLAAKHRLDRPANLHGDVDWDRVAEERLAFARSPSDIPALDSLENPDVRRMAAFQFHRLSGNPHRALAQWRKHPWYFKSIRLQLALAALLVEEADEQAVKILDQVTAVEPASADGLLGRLRALQRRLPEAAPLLLSMIEAGQNSPWVASPVLERVLATLPTIAKSNHELGLHFFASLKKPFAVSLLENTRIATRLSIAEAVNFKDLCEEAMSDFEPFVPWNGDFLSRRLECYRSKDNPLAAKAERDLEQYLEGGAVPFEINLAEPQPAPAISPAPKVSTVENAP
jgi:predicted membrane-bound spermidine synthase